ncbi:MAG TPA: tetraacyldisaccharide 4'-kinase, partial [Gillisia sp.]|nr:tetraacyldisaccharide 4'-kinase [Gillisia sp.]
IGAGRAKIIVVTKCPENLSLEEQEVIRTKLKPKNHQHLFFSYISYNNYVFNGKDKIQVQELIKKEITLVTGIANPSSLCEYLKDSGIVYNHLNFPDHHKFSTEEIREISKQSFVVTTEKDFMRLKGKIAQEKLFYLPIEMKFIRNTDEFNNEITAFIINEK